MTTSAASGPAPRWLGAVERRLRAHPWVLDVLLALTLAGVLGTLTSSALRSMDIAVAELVAIGVAFGVLHVVVAVRRSVPAVAYVAASLAMFVVVLLPDAHATDASTGRPVAVPVLFLPSSLVFLVVLYSAAGWPPRRLGRLVAPIAVIGALPATIRGAGAIRPFYPGGWLVSVYLGAALVITVLATWGLGTLQLIRRQRGAAERAEATRLAVLEERSRIARDMHDVVAHSLAVIVRQAEGGAFAAGRAPDQAVQALRVIADTGRDALDDMRGLLGVLRDRSDEAAARSTTAPRPSLTDLSELVDRVRETGLDVECVRRGAPYDAGAATELAAYRVVQEALTNTIKHAGPDARVQVRLEWSATELTVAVTDHGDGGDGTPVPVPGAGAGLQGLSERVAAVGGTFTAGPQDHGFRVRASFPRRQPGGTR